ncbi:MAG: TonB-dependent receptor, partial [Hyphomonadaceae bacterium]|nr:TonB-dependent receptor [Hyphomonadaceae bacterium]
MKIQLLTTSALVLGSLAAPLALAQETDEPASTRTLGTVTVTAQKREQTLQDVPVAVSVVDQAQIENAQVLDLSDLQSLVPSLRVSTLQNSAQTTFLIRGFGNGANNAGIEPSVGVFIDGVYRSRSAAAIADLPNLARVEVLRGPQSTLFGKNASAGVVSVITQKPQFEASGLIEAGVTNYNGYNVKAYFTGPIAGDELAFAVSGNVTQRDGYTENLLGGEDVNDRNRYSLRGELLFEPSSNLSIRLMGDYSNIDEICCTLNVVQNGPTAQIAQALGGQVMDPSDPFSYEVYFNTDPVNEVEDRGLSGTVEYDFGSVVLTSISAYRENDSFYDSEVDYTGADLVDSASSDTAIQTFTQEFRLASDTDGPLSWLAGAFYFDEDVDQQTGLSSGTLFRSYVDILVDQQPLGPNGTLAGIEQILGIPYGTFYSADRRSMEYFTQSDESLSLFAQLDYDVTDRLTLTGGLNFTQVEKDVTGYSDNNFLFSAVDLDGAQGAQIIAAQGYAMTFPGVFQAQTGLAPTPENIAAFAGAMPDAFAALQAGVLAGVQAQVAQLDLSDPAQNPLLGLQPLQFVPPFLSYPNSVEAGSTSDEETTWTLRAAYDVTDNINVYVSAGTGFKASSWNLSRDSRPFASDAMAIMAAGLA